MASYSTSLVSDFELAVLVLRYLDANGCTKASATFKREAKKIFGNKSPDSVSEMKPLINIVNEYLTYDAQQRQRNELFKKNPLAKSLSTLLNSHAGIATAPTAPFSQIQQPHQNIMQNPAGFIYSSQQQPIVIPPHSSTVYVPNNPSLSPNQLTHLPSLPQNTPGRHAQRKRASKKKRKLDLDTIAAQNNNHITTNDSLSSPGPLTFSPPSIDFPPSDLLNKTMNQDTLEMLLTDAPLQSRFAEGLANQLNSLDDPNNFFDTMMSNADLTAVLNTLVMSNTLEENIAQIATIDTLHGVHAENTNEKMVREHSRKGLSDLKEEVSIEKGQGGGDALKGKKHKGEKSASLPHDKNGNDTQNGIERERRLDDDVIAQFMSNPDQFEDLIDECIG